MTMWCKTCRAFTEWTSERCCDCGRGLDLNCAQPFFASEGRTAGLIEIPRGTILGERFNVIEECGAGRSGTIFVVFDGILGHAVAAKVTAAAPEASGEAARLQREVTLYERVRDHRDEHHEEHHHGGEVEPAQPGGGDELAEHRQRLPTTVAATNCGPRPRRCR